MRGFLNGLFSFYLPECRYKNKTKKVHFIFMMNRSITDSRWYLSAIFYKYTYIRIVHQVDEDLFAYLGDRIRGALIADCGCGPGIMAEKLLRRGAARILAIDVNPAMLNQTRRRLAIYAANAQVDIVRSSFYPESFSRVMANSQGRSGLDIILFKRSLYIRPEQAKHILAAASQYLAPGGMLVIIHPERSIRHYAFDPGLKLMSYTAYHLFDRAISLLADYLGLGHYTVYSKTELLSMVQTTLPHYKVESIRSQQNAYNLVAAYPAS
jgi:SAM-dependent methyltransferase